MTTELDKNIHLSDLAGDNPGRPGSSDASGSRLPEGEAASCRCERPRRHRFRPSQRLAGRTRT